MSDTMTVKEAARLWNLTERRVVGLCREGKITGAKKQGRSWQIPATAKKPLDQRIKSGAYKKQSGYPIIVWHLLNIIILIRP